MRVRLYSVVAVLVLSMVFTACSGTPKGDQAAADQPATTAEGSNSTAPFASSDTQSADTGKKGLFGSSPKVPSSITIPAGTVVAVRLQNTVSSATAQPGDSFDAVLDEALVVKGQTVAPRGAPVTGRVVEAKSSGRLHNSGYLRLTLASITINGKEHAIQTSSMFAKGANHNKRNAAMIGGGAGAGALIGGLAGGGKGALIGAAVGAGAGTGGAYATGKKDVSFAAERRLSFRLTQSLTTKS
ncbi:MAG TPA: hypothetical protein VN577_23560 [Terriglobales bacterium]|nr:hypothetical protein [Terriglobales bacterium]